MFGILKDLNHHKRDGAIPGKFHFYEKEKKKWWQGRSVIQSVHVFLL